ncbi:MAG TPA: amidohydrolase family protein [Verrucomicrobiae bacterium]|nr:amidohydrolase family protein [Verrucomicrobiae bacterium]
MIPIAQTGFAMLAWMAFSGASQVSVAAAELLPPGFRPLPHGVHALVGATVVVRPGTVLESATIVIRDGRFDSVNTNLAVPADARVWPMQGTTIYAGFIEPYLILNAGGAPVSTSEAFPVNESSLAAGGTRFYGAPGVQNERPNEPTQGNERFVPERRSVDGYTASSDSLRPLRELGFTAAVLAPGKGILRGRSSLVSLREDSVSRVVLKSDLFQHIAFDTSNNEPNVYPASLMGVIASVRQTFFNAQHQARTTAANGSRTFSVSFDDSLEALAATLERRAPAVFEAGSALMNERAAQVAHEFGIPYHLVASGEEWRRPDLLQTNGPAYIVPVNFPAAPKLPAQDDWEQISLDQLRAWDWAAENPAILAKSGARVALTTHGLDDRKHFRRNLQLALDRGLSEMDALAALTTIPARICGVDKMLGTIEPGKIANLVVVHGTNYFNPENRVRAVWIDGRIYPSDVSEPIAGETEKARPVQTREPDATPSREEPEAHPRPAGTSDTAAAATNSAAGATAAAQPERKLTPRELLKERVARSPLERRGATTNPGSLLIRGATVWTAGPQGILTNGSLLVSGGKIQQAGHFKTEVAQGTFVIDGAGLHVTPGIVDCHSHAAILGNGNEMGVPSSAMVRIADVVNSESENLYRQLAGGVTTINLLHGSANPIGGQSCVIKLRDGQPPAGLLFTNAPAGIKFALGENVKQANWGDRFTTRFPQTRMGVRTFIQNRFVAAQQYQADWDKFRAANGGGVAEPRRDLELEAIADILRGERWIHCHAYRQDEMLMLTRLMQGFGVQIATFQHALEAYKIADELAAANIGVSLFSDWWGFKFELFDAIPYNGSVARERGLLVSFNSDFSELARRLYVEAAKAVKYGGTPEHEALKFITINPARQLRIDSFTGSLEPGKDADFAIWSRSPLDSTTVCLQTWIEGRRYFDREADADRIEQLRRERDALVAKARRASDAGGAGGEAPAGGKSFFEVSLEQRHEHSWRCDGE